MKTQLLCTFASKEDMEEVLQDVIKNYEIIFDKIYVFQNEEKFNEIIFTYNVSDSKNLNYNLVPNTISLHRKKHSNTLYTINALNELIKNLNNGVLNKDFPIPWENFQNMLLVTNKDGLNRISTRILKIVNLNEKNNDFEK
jgi:hypothetical protein